MNKYNRFVPLLPMLIALVSAANAQTSQAHPFIGKWNLNLAQSHFKPGPGPKSGTVVVASDGKTTVSELTADGKTTSWSFVPSVGRAVPIEGLENSTVLHNQTGNVVEDDWKFDGTKLKGHGVLSKDGKRITYTQTGTDPEGHPIHNVRVYDRASS